MSNQVSATIYKPVRAEDHDEEEMLSMPITSSHSNTDSNSSFYPSPSLLLLLIVVVSTLANVFLSYAVFSKTDQCRDDRLPSQSVDTAVPPPTDNSLLSQQLDASLKELAQMRELMPFDAFHRYMDESGISGAMESEETIKKKIAACNNSGGGIDSSGGFCVSKNNSDVGGNSFLDDHVANFVLENFFLPRAQIGSQISIGDFGAGVGQYRAYFLSHDTRKVIGTYLAYDGAANIAEASNGVVQYLDLSRAVPVSEKVPKFDYIWSTEVGEHIAIQWQGNYLDNVVRHCRYGMVLSWAIPGQGGFYHVNEQPREYVVDRLKERGFIYQEDLSAKMREKATVGWFKNTLMIFINQKFL